MRALDPLCYQDTYVFMLLRLFICLAGVCSLIGGPHRGEAATSEDPFSWAEITSERTRNWWDHIPHDPNPPEPSGVPRRHQNIVQENREHGPIYDRRYTFSRGIDFIPDPFVWSYTAAFAKRFYMPEKWVDTDLKGATALAFRVREPLVYRCGLDGKEENCDTRKVCELDLYYDNRIALPWNTPHIRRDNLVQGVHSGMFLYDPEYEFRSLNHHFYKRRPDGTRQPGPLASGGQFYVQGKAVGSQGEVTHFDQAFAPALGQISWQGVCPPPTGSDPVTLPFYDASGKQMHQVQVPQRWLKEAIHLWETEGQEPARMPKMSSDEDLSPLGRALTGGWDRLFTSAPPPSKFPSVDDEHYQKTFTFRDKKPFIRDTWVWAYTREFAERFQMPEEWIDPDLKGALAIAYRMSPLGHRRCGHVGVKDLCDPTLYVQQDIYYDTATTPMTWVYSDVFRDYIDIFMNSSTALNGPEADRTGLNRRFYWGRGADDPNFKDRYEGDNWQGKKLTHTYVIPAFFDREYRPGVGLFSTISHSLGDRNRPPPDDVIEHPGDVALWRQKKIKNEDIRALHRFEVPPGLWERAHDLYEANKAEARALSNGMYNAVFGK
jgi:hypothetical protein